MNHDEAIRLMGTEQYLLNELAPELREQFEEHFFECIECANDVRAGELFLEHSKAILAAETAAPQRDMVSAKPEKQSWWAWLRPAIAVPAMALLLAVIAYQNRPSHPYPQVLQATYVNVGARGGSVPSISASRDRGFLLRVSFPADAKYSSYSAKVFGPDEDILWLLRIPIQQDQDTYFIQVPPSKYVEGTYSIGIFGTAVDGSSTEIGRGSFELHMQK